MVVHKNELFVTGKLELVDATQEVLEVIGLVVHRNDQRKARRVGQGILYSMGLGQTLQCISKSMASQAWWEAAEGLVCLHLSERRHFAILRSRSLSGSPCRPTR